MVEDRCSSNTKLLKNSWQLRGSNRSILVILVLVLLLLSRFRVSWGVMDLQMIGDKGRMLVRPELGLMDE